MRPRSHLSPLRIHPCQHTSTARTGNLSCCSSLRTLQVATAQNLGSDSCVQHSSISPIFKGLEPRILLRLAPARRKGLGSWVQQFWVFFGWVTTSICPFGISTTPIFIAKSLGIEILEMVLLHTTTITYSGYLWFSYILWVLSVNKSFIYLPQLFLTVLKCPKIAGAI